MRPKRIILCAGSDAQRLSVLRFTLETRGFRVLAAASSDEAIAIHKESIVPIDLILSDLGTLDGNRMVRIIRGDGAKDGSLVQPGPRVLQIGRPNTPRGFHCLADMYLPWELLSTAEILARVRTLTARKRGPKPKTRTFRHDTVTWDKAA